MATRPPNILLLMTDQQRADTIAALGNPIIRTPTLDRLVREGSSFTRAYTPSPVCAPARCSLVTGQPPHATGVVDNEPLTRDLPSFMDRLAARGYQTHGVGKMHFTPDFQRMWGFESRDIGEEGKNDDFRAYLRGHGFDWVDDPNGVRGEHYYLPQPSQLPARHHNTTWTADRAIDFLERRDSNRPFLLFTSFIKPHPPFELPDPWNKLYRTSEMPAPWLPPDAADYQTRINRVQNRYKYRDRATHDDLLARTTRAAYYGAISQIDWNIARILDRLGPEIDNTLILFFSDHGELLGDYGCVGKRCMLEASARIPLIARLPGSFEAGTRNATPATLLDIFPTILTAAGDPDPGVSPEGQPLQSLGGDRIVFSQFQRGWMGNYLATDGRHKYVHSAADDREDLFAISDDLREGPTQIDDGSLGETKDRLKRALLDRHRGCPGAVAGGDWVRHEAPPFPEDPDYGLLRQDFDPAALQRRIDALGPGYARDSTLPDEEAYRIIFDHSVPQPVGSGS